jgi:acetamidase/formamidase
VLEVRFKSIKPAINYACNSFGPRSGFLREDFPKTSRSKVIELDTVRMLGHFSSGITIPLHPFFGSVGVAPPASMGRVNTAPPGIHAGNLDNKELVAGSTLYIPVWTKGALLEVGDGHAGQGNGDTIVNFSRNSRGVDAVAVNSRSQL